MIIAGTIIKCKATVKVIERTYKIYGPDGEALRQKCTQSPSIPFRPRDIPEDSNSKCFTNHTDVVF